MIDTHCHIDLYDAPLEVATATEKLGVKTVDVTYLPSHFVQACKHLAGFKHVRPALGLHPLAAKGFLARKNLGLPGCDLVDSLQAICEEGRGDENVGVSNAVGN